MGVEALLDIEYINAVAAPVPLTVYYSSTYSLLDWATKLNDDDNAELVHSVSYGNDEAQQTSSEYMESCNTEFMKAGTRGLSLFFASGDQGVWGREGLSGNVFHPDFPGASPYITTVGGTNFASQSHIGEETVWNGGVGGSSAACPVVAGIFTQLNNIRLNAGKPALGFVNPLIYQNPNAFYDVTTGTNDGGYKIGFEATKGWDPASGMGTPNFTALKKVISNLD